MQFYGFSFRFSCSVRRTLRIRNQAISFFLSLSLLALVEASYSHYHIFPSVNDIRLIANECCFHVFSTVLFFFSSFVLRPVCAHSLNVLAQKLLLAAIPFHQFCFVEFPFSTICGKEMILLCIWNCSRKPNKNQIWKQAFRDVEVALNISRAFFFETFERPRFTPWNAVYAFRHGQWIAVQMFISE